MNVRPLHDRLPVRRIEQEASEVLAVGNGKFGKYRRDIIDGEEVLLLREDEAPAGAGDEDSKKH